jgi:hypothetical protein
MNSLVTLALLGTAFFILQNFSITPGGNWLDKLRNAVCGALWGGMIGGWMLISKFVFDSPEKTKCALGIGAALTVIGWFRAEHLVLLRAGFKLASQQSRKSTPQYKVPKGLGGIPLLMTTAITRVLLMWAFIAAVMIGMSVFDSHATSASLSKSLELIIPSISMFPLWINIIFIFPVLQQLRLLRTLPLSTTALAIVLVLLPVLSTMTMGVVTMSLTIPILGAAKGSLFIGNFLMAATMLALCIPVAVMLGFGRQTLFIIYFLAVLSFPFFGTFAENKLPLLWIAPISGLLIAIAIFLTKKSLIKSRNAYRAWPNLFGNNWGWGR